MLARLLITMIGGLVLFDFFNDSSPIGFVGKILEWCKAYDAIIEIFVRPLFAWIHLGWISVSSIETHLLVVQSILGAAVIFTSIRLETRTFISAFDHLAMLPIYYISLMTPVLLTSLFLPGWLGAVGAIGGLVVATFLAYNQGGISHGDDGLKEWPLFITQGIVAAALFDLLLITIYYKFFAY